MDTCNLDDEGNCRHARVVMLPDGKLTSDDGFQHSFTDPRRCAEADLAVLRVIVKASIKRAAVEKEDQLLRTCTCNGKTFCLKTQVIWHFTKDVSSTVHFHDQAVYACYYCRKAISSMLEVYCQQAYLQAHVPLPPPRSCC